MQAEFSLPPCTQLFQSDRVARVLRLILGKLKASVAHDLCCCCGLRLPVQRMGWVQALHLMLRLPVCNNGLGASAALMLSKLAAGCRRLVGSRSLRKAMHAAAPGSEACSPFLLN